MQVTADRKSTWSTGGAQVAPESSMTIQDRIISQTALAAIAPQGYARARIYPFTGVAKEAFSPFEIIKRDLTQIGLDRRAEINGCSNYFNSVKVCHCMLVTAFICGMIPFYIMLCASLTCHRNNMAKFREREMELLYKYFNENPTFEAYHLISRQNYT